MKTTILKSFLFALPLAASMAIPTAFAETITGKINGHGCAHAGVTCPADRLDPHITLEADFVLQKGDGEYLFLPNLPRDTKVRYVLKDVKVTGGLDKKRHSLIVDKFMVKSGGAWKTVWSQKEAQEELDALYEWQ